MKREEKNAQSRQRILEGALREFAAKGYEAASLNTICAQNDISKGIIYHYFKDKDELYLLCVDQCFSALAGYMREAVAGLSGTVEDHLRGYFDARLRFFAEHPLFLGIFANAALNPPAHLSEKIARQRDVFDALNISVLTGLLDSQRLRPGITVAAVVEDFRMYMDFFNTRFRAALQEKRSPEQVLREHEERCHRQLDVLLHGVLDSSHE